MAEPVSWLMIERPWDVVGSDGGELGKVEEVVGDSGRDIFNGLVVACGLLSRPRYVPAELVTEIVEGRVTLSIGQDGFDQLEEHSEPPPTKQIQAD